MYMYIIIYMYVYQVYSYDCLLFVVHCLLVFVLLSLSLGVLGACVAKALILTFCMLLCILLCL